MSDPKKIIGGPNSNSTRQRWLMLFIAVLIPSLFTFHQSLSLQLSLTTQANNGAADSWLPNNNGITNPDNNPSILSMDLTTPKTASALVHYDPMFIGGFRNQHMRFVAFVNFAVSHNISQILLPSLRWGDAFNKGMSAPHEMLFDVVYWNERADKMGLPKLVRYDKQVLEGMIGSNNNETGTLVSCFNSSSSLYSGLDEQLLRSPGTNLRRVQSWDHIGKGEMYSHCRRTLGHGGENNPDSIRKEWENKIDAARLNGTESNIAHRYTHLIPYGGMGGAGKLWNDYGHMQRARVKGPQSAYNPEHVHVEKAIYTLMRPSEPIRSAIENAISETQQQIMMTNMTNKRPRLLALHPRVEWDMMIHRCSKHMETNLTKVFEHLRQIPTFDMVFLALNKAKVDVTPTSNEYADFRRCNPRQRQMAIENSVLLNYTRSHGLFGTDDKKGKPIFESGLYTAAKIRFPNTYGHHRSNIHQSDNQTLLSADSLGVIDLVASIVNFFTAIRAEVFVGVRGSSFSNEVSSVRYYQQSEEGQEKINYIVSPTGIEGLFGPSAPHFC